MPPAGDSPDRIPNGLIVTLVIIFFIIIAAGAILYQSQEEQITHQVTRDLTAIANLKASQIVSWREDRLFDARVLASSPFLIEGVDHFLSHGDNESREKILGRFGEMNTSFHYRNVVLVDPEGEVRLSLDPGFAAVAPDTRGQVAESLRTGTATLTDFYRAPQTGQISIDVIAPLLLDRDGGKLPVGAVILSIDPEEFLYPYIQSWPVPSETAETLLVERDGDQVLFLNNLRHRQNTALNLTIPLTESQVPAVMAVLGTTGAFSGRDYRNVEVISVLEPVRGSPWYIVAKVDTADAYSAWRSRSLLIIIVVAGTLAGALFLAGLVWQRRQKYFYRSLYAAEAKRREDEEKNRERMETLLRLAEMGGATEQELSDFVLDAACRLTASPLAFIGTMTADESVFDITAWSKTAMKDCAVAQSPIHYPIGNAGIWAEAVRQRKPLVVNDYAAPARGKKGLPPGHVPVTRFVSLPIFEEQRIVMVCAVANKDADYTQADVDNLMLLMQGVWNQVRKRNAEEALRQKTTDLEAAYEEITASGEELQANYDELVRIQRALGESEAKFRETVKLLDEGYYRCTFDGVLIEHNLAFNRILGFDADRDLKGSLLPDFWQNPSDRSGYLEELMDKGYIRNFTIPAKTVTGRPMIVLASAHLTRTGSGEIEGIEGTFSDITDLRQAEEAIRTNERELNALFQSMINAFVLFESVFDESGRFVSYRFVRINDAYERITGVKSDEVRGRTVHEVWPGTEESWVRVYGEVAVTGVPASFDMYHEPTKKFYHCNVYRPQKSSDRFCVVFEDITDRMRAEEEIRFKNVILATQQESSPDAILIVDDHGNVLMYNRNFVKVWNIPADLLATGTDEPLLRYVTSQLADPDAFLSRVLYLYDHKDEKSFEELLLKDGRVFERYSAPMTGETGRYYGRVWYFRDITGRKQAEEALRESEERYREFFTTSRDSIFITTPGGEWIDFNETALEMFGYSSREELMALPLPQLYEDPEYRPVFLERIETDGYVKEFPIRLKRNDGTVLDTLITAVPIRNPEGSVRAYVGSIRNVTAMKRAVQALREQEEFTRAVLDNLPIGIAVNSVDPGVRFEYLNENFVKIYRISREDLADPGTFWEAVYKDPVFRESIKNRVLEDSASGDPARMHWTDIPVERPGEPVFYVDARNVKVPDKDLMISMVWDVTERKQAEETREHLIRQLEQKNAELERFTYTVSHDLKSPLITIRGFAGLLESDARDPLLLKKDVGRIITAADTMQQLLSDVLELSRVGKIASPSQKIPFSTIAREAVELLAGPLTERGVTVDIAPDLPEVFVDHARIREVMVNLIENAIKFLGNQPDPVIRIGADCTGEMPVFFIADNGIGIDPRYLERIFNLFERLDVATYGTGVGLTIVRRIIEVHGGKIWAESEGIGKGATFRFTLPGKEEK
jgi:PAS domain S-box-containing protein